MNSHFTRFGGFALHFSDFGTGRPTSTGGGEVQPARDELFATGHTARAPDGVLGWVGRLLWGASGVGGFEEADYEIRQGSRKAVLISLASEAWKKGRFDARSELKEARGREIEDEDHLLRVLSRTTASELEVVVEKAVRQGETVGVEGRLKGSAPC